MRATSLIESRRRSSTARLRELTLELTAAEELARGKACVCAIGSFGRAEASDHSDLDLVLLGKSENDRPTLSRLDQICLEADLIRAARNRGYPEFSGDGKYLRLHTVHDLVANLGTEKDDVTNTFTIRLLLLLESRSLLGDIVYTELIDQLVSAYWREFEGHREKFLPAFLANDILRLWRTFYINYEARTLPESPEEKAKRKLRNYKLKHSRLLTCYSGLAFLLATFAEHDTVTPDDATQMVRSTPTERLERIGAIERFASCRPAVARLIERYETFLTTTDASDADLLVRFMNPEATTQFAGAMDEFGNAMWDLLEAIGEGNRMLRMLIV